MKKILKSIWSIMRHNIGLKVAAFIFAIILWNYVVAYVDMPRTKVVSDVQVRYLYENSLSARDMSLVNGDTALLPFVRVDLNINRSEYGYVNAGNVRVYADLTQVTETGVKQITLTAESDYGNVISITPGTITVETEQLLELEVPIVCEFVGALGESLWKDKEVLSPAKLKITGAATQVAQVASARVIVDLSNVTGKFLQTLECELLDENGNPVSREAFRGLNTSVIVSIPVYPTKKILIDTQDAFINLEPGYMIEEFILITGTSITVAAEQAVLDRLDTVTFKVDLAGLKDNTQQYNISFIWNEPIMHYDPRPSYVLVTVAEERETKVFDQMRVWLEPTLDVNENERQEYADERVRVELEGPKSWINSLAVSDIHCYVDIDGLPSGTHELQVQVRIADIDQSENTVIMPGTVTVTIP